MPQNDLEAANMTTCNLVVLGMTLNYQGMTVCPRDVIECIRCNFATTLNSRVTG